MIAMIAERMLESLFLDSKTRITAPRAGMTVAKRRKYWTIPEGIQASTNQHGVATEGF